MAKIIRAFNIPDAELIEIPKSLPLHINPRDLWETYLPAFKDLVQNADVKEVMYVRIPCSLYLFRF